VSLAGAAAFAAVFERGRRLDGRYMQLIVAAGARPPSRAGFVISRKALRRAVDRNRLRRQVRAMLVQRAAAFEAPFDVVVRVKPPLTRADLPAAADEARRLVARVG
jgi:ribonuclease P protein component